MQGHADSARRYEKVLMRIRNSKFEFRDRFKTDNGWMIMAIGG